MSQHDEVRDPIPTSPAGDFPFWVVGVGASAGGLESLERFFANMPVMSGAAFVVVQHLSPDFRSVMDELLARRTSIPIHQARDGLPLEPNAIYLIPPRKEAIIADRRIHLADKEPKDGLSLPIDHFFRSLAANAGKRAIAVVLSGSGSDGSRGIRDIHQCGGFVLSESEETARFDGMPHSARETGVVDQVLSPEDMPASIMEHIAAASEDLEENAYTLPADRSMEAIFQLLNDEYGIDFSHYKGTTVGRRIQRRLEMRQFEDVNRYAVHLGEDPAELNSLYKDLLIGVTKFFRDGEAFEKLERAVIPDLLSSVDSERELRVWIAACATGEEAYSVAMLFHEQLEQSSRPTNLKIFATDVHKSSLEFASAAVYSEESVKQVSPARLARYFTKVKDGYHVDADLRKLVVFAPHNVLKDAPFTKLDLIVCRNLLIYFQPLAQKKALSLFHFGLRTGGVLMLGPSESPGELYDEFEPLDEHWKMFRKRRDVRLPSDMRYPLPRGVVQGTKIGPRALITSPVRGVPDPALLGAYDWVMSQHVPPSLLIDEHHELLHVFSGAERYLKIRTGRPSSDALDYLQGDLRSAVFGALQRAKKEPGPITYEAVRLNDDQSETCRVVVQRVVNPRAPRPQYLIRLELPAPQAPTSNVATSGDSDHRQISRDRIETLENELLYTKENLQATVEELETSNEELQATNEELVASNEELQSTNEELHSVNEELYTVNAEYQKKIDALTELTSDMDSLMESTDVATIFLDHELCIRKFTPQIAPIFKLLPHDLGRCIDSFTHLLQRDNLIGDLRHVLDTGEPLEAEVQDRDGKWKYMRVLPYRSKKQVQGVVLTLIDIASLKRAQDSLSLAVKQRETFLATLSHELRNPMSALVNATHLLDVQPNDQATRDWAIGVVRRQSQHLTRMLDDLLDVSRITQSKFELRQRPFDLRTALEAAVETMLPALEERGHQLRLEVCDQPLMVDGDPDRLRQVQVNLLDNAIKYSPGNGEICLRARREGNMAVIRVADSGEGLTQQAIQQIFQPFFQAGNNGTHRSSGGMGLGLSLVRLIAEQHGGSVEVRSDGPGQGSEFTVRIPMLTLGDAGNDGDSRAMIVRPTAESAGTCKIVLVEDQPDNRFALTRWLELKGHQVHAAADGLAGVALLEQEQPDVGIIDIGLPRIDGYEVARRVRAGTYDRPPYLIALTGYGQSMDIDAAAQAGFDHHMTKPVNLADLQRVLMEHAAATQAAQNR